MAPGVGQSKTKQRHARQANQGAAHFPRFDPSHAKGQLGALTGNQPANFNPLSFPRIGWEWEWGIGGLDWIGNEF